LGQAGDLAILKSLLVGKRPALDLKFSGDVIRESQNRQLTPICILSVILLPKETVETVSIYLTHASGAA
jgi:hypothetical protein